VETRGPAAFQVPASALQMRARADRLGIVDGLQNYFSFTLMASTGQLDLHSKHAEQLLGFVTMGCSSNHSRTPKVQASTHFLQPVQRQ